MAFDETDETMTFSWKDVIDRCEDVMFFGRPFDGVRPFDDLFKNKKDVEYAHHVFRQFASEYKGDARASAQLYAAYQKRLRQTWQNLYNCNSLSALSSDRIGEYAWRMRKSYDWSVAMNTNWDGRPSSRDPLPISWKYVCISRG